MGGHFRTEPASPLPEVKVEKPGDVGPDPFVGVRPAFDLSPESATALIKKRLATDAGLARVTVKFDPDAAAVTLTGPVAGPSARHSADRLLEGLWFVAAVDNQLQTTALNENQLAILGEPTGESRRVAVLDRTFVEIPLSVRWLDPLPVQGSSWWANIYLPGGGHLAHKLDPTEPGRVTKVGIRVDRDKLAEFGLTDTSAMQVALSLGSPAPNLSEPRIVSNIIGVHPTLPAGTR
jgi:hypothetical protein